MANMIPKSPDGSIGILYGIRGDHKTNTLLSLLDASRATRILYAAGEGAYGLERDRISARPGLRGRIKLLPRVPMFARPEEVEAFVEGSNSIGFRPEIVVLDTLATALAGEDENTSMTAAHLSDNGACGYIKRAWNCTVIVIAHAGKDASRGVRGSSGFEGNVDFIIYCTANKADRTIELECKKMRDGADGHSTYWHYEATGIPVPREIGSSEYRKLTTPEPAKEIAWGGQVQFVLRQREAIGWARGFTAAELAPYMAENDLGPKPGDDAPRDVLTAWNTCSGKWKDRLNQSANQKAAWARGWNDRRANDESDKLTLRWFVPPEDQIVF